MAEKNKIFLILAAAVLIIYTVLCADPFESLFVRLNCYKKEQPGCDTDFIQAYPNLSRSHDNLTYATTYFFLFTNENPEDPELLHKCAGKLPPDSKFNPKCPTEIFFPGFVSGVCNFAIFRELKNERLKSGCYNVILTDYMWGNIPDLVEAKLNLYIVAKQSVIVIRNLKEEKGLTGADFILTGHSYGAHLAGFIGQEESIGQIIALDPAGGLFTEETDLDHRLDAGDADCVQVWHCNAGDCLPYFFGLNFTCGTIDFWINGGSFQPSCFGQTAKSFLKGDFIYACFHFQCLQYYKASMNPTNCPFIGVQCKSYKDFQRNRCRNCGRKGEKGQVMGIHTCSCLTDDKKNKSYYLNTANECPYCENSRLRRADRVTCEAAGIKG